MHKQFFIDLSSFDKILVHFKLQTCFVLPGLFSAIRSFKKIIYIYYINMYVLAFQFNQYSVSIYIYYVYVYTYIMYEDV